MVFHIFKELCNHHQQSILGHFYHSEKKPFTSFKSHSSFLQYSQLLETNNPLSVSSANSGHCLYMDHTIYGLWRLTYHTAKCFQSSSMLQQVSEFPSIFRLNNTSLYVQIMFSLSIQLLMDVWVTSTFWVTSTLWLFWIGLLKWVYKYLFKSLLLILLGIYPVMVLLNHVVNLFLIFWGTATLFFFAF